MDVMKPDRTIDVVGWLVVVLVLIGVGNTFWTAW